MVKLVTFMLILSASALNFQQQLSKSITVEWTVDNESIYIRFKVRINLVQNYQRLLCNRIQT